MSELQEWVARNRPGQGVNVTYRRNGHEFQVKAKLKNPEGSEQLKKKEVEYEMAGAVFEELGYKELTELNLDGGVLIKKLEDGKWKKAGVRKEFIVTHIDKIPIDHVADLNRILELKQGGILVEGVYREGEKATYGVVW